MSISNLFLLALILWASGISAAAFPPAAEAVPTAVVSHSAEAVSVSKALVPRPIVIAGSGAARAASRALLRPPALRNPREWAKDVWEAVRKEGWLWAQVAFSAQSDTLYLQSGPRARIADVSKSGADSSMWSLFTTASGIRKGALYRPGHWEEDCAAGLATISNRGYPFASLSVRKMEADPATAGVRLDLLLLPGSQANLGKITVEGATHTKPEILVRLSGLREGQIWSERRLRSAREKLEAREIVHRVVEAELLLSGSDLSIVDVLLKVEQPKSTGRISAALGMVGGEENKDTRLYGNVDLVLLDLLGTARQFSLRFLDDGRTRRTLDLSYLEPLVFHSPFDLILTFGQRHQEEVFDTILANLALRIPWRGANNVELGGGIDRSSFVGDEGLLRIRRRALMNLRLGSPRPAGGGGIFGRLSSRFEYARVSQSVQNPGPAQAASSSSQQTIADVDLRLGLALGKNLAVQTRARWASVSTGDLPVLLSEQFFLGGATTVRGHREDERHGEIVSHGSLEFVLGPARKGNMYAFYDLGYIRQTIDVAGRLQKEENWIRGFGMGLRTPAPFGRLDLSLGFPGTLSFSQGVIHLSMINEF